MLSRDDARHLAQVEATRESAHAGVSLVIERTVETSRHWVFLLNSEAYARTGRAVDSCAAEVAPVVVAKHDGTLSRPFAPGEVPEREFRRLSPDEWLVVPLRTATDPPPGLGALSPQWCAQAARRMGIFRITPGFRGDGDTLTAVIVAHSPSALASGIASLGLEPDDSGSTPYREGRIVVRAHPTTASVTVWIGGNETAWTIGDRDVDLAVSLERRLHGAEWVRGYSEPSGSLTPASHPELFSG